MDAIDDAFGSGIINRQRLSRPLRRALAIGKATLNKYYNLTDESDIYRVSMGTLPCCPFCALFKYFSSATPFVQVILFRQS